jgi:hypothetical protein
MATRRNRARKRLPKTAGGQVSRKVRKAMKRGALSAARWRALRSQYRRRTRVLRSLENPALKRVRRSTGWIQAKRVKIVRRRGRTDILVERPRRARRRR